MPDEGVDAMYPPVGGELAVSTISVYVTILEFAVGLAVSRKE